MAGNLGSDEDMRFEEAPEANAMTGSSTSKHIMAASSHALLAIEALGVTEVSGPLGAALAEAVKQLRNASDLLLQQQQQQQEHEQLAQEMWNVPSSARFCSSIGYEPGNLSAWGADSSTLCGSGAWGPNNNLNEWLQLDLAEPGGMVGGVATKGKIYTWQGGPTFSGWVSKYRVKYLENGKDEKCHDAWSYVDGGRIFEGNEDALNTVVRYFDKPVFSKSLRIETVDWSRPGGTVLKVDLLRHQTICLTLAPRLVDASNVAVVVTNMDGTTVDTLEFEAESTASSLWSELSVKLKKPPRWLQLVLVDGTLLSQDESKEATLANLLKIK